MRRGYEVSTIEHGHMVIALHADLFNRSVTSQTASSGQLIRSGTFLCQNAIEGVLQGNLMVNLPPELGSPDVWAGGGVGLIAGLLLRYFIVRVFIVFRLFGREWSFDLKDRTRTDNHTDPR